MFSFVLFDPRDPDAAERRRPPRLADVRGDAGRRLSCTAHVRGDVRPVVPPRIRRG